MIGLVLVSHSDKLVEGLRDLVVQMEPSVPLAIAGGTDDGELGTSLDLVNAAIDEADQGAGVVILYDLGSAQMIADSAVEFLDDDRRELCLVVDAPLVEGAIAAAGAAGGNANLGAVAAAAAGAARPDEEEEQEWLTGTEGLGEAIELRLTNVGGLHARPAGQIARAMRALDADVHIELVDSGHSVKATSTLRLVSLGATAGTSIIVRADGPDASEALITIRDLVSNRFGEEAAEL